VGRIFFRKFEISALKFDFINNIEGPDEKLP